jgi:histidyl-tRNA synthetase
MKEQEPEWKEEYTVTTIGSVSPVDKLRVVNYIQNLFPQKKVVYDFTAKDRKFTKTLQDCAVNYSRYIVIVAETEWKEGLIKLKDLKEKTEQTINVSPV